MRSVSRVARGGARQPNSLPTEDASMTPTRHTSFILRRAAGALLALASARGLLLVLDHGRRLRRDRDGRRRRTRVRSRGHALRGRRRSHRARPPITCRVPPRHARTDDAGTDDGGMTLGLRRHAVRRRGRRATTASTTWSGTRRPDRAGHRRSHFLAFDCYQEGRRHAAHGRGDARRVFL